MNPIGMFTHAANTARSAGDRFVGEAKMRMESAAQFSSPALPPPPREPPIDPQIIEEAAQTASDQVANSVRPVADWFKHALRFVADVFGHSKLQAPVGGTAHPYDETKKQSAGKLGELAVALGKSPPAVPAEKYGKLGTTLAEHSLFEKTVPHLAGELGNVRFALESETAVRARVFGSQLGAPSAPSDQLALIGAEQEARITIGKLTVEEDSLEQFPDWINAGGGPSRVKGTLEIDALSLTEEARATLSATLSDLGVKARIEAFAGIRVLDVDGKLELRHLTRKPTFIHSDPYRLEESSLTNWSATAKGRTEVGVFGSAEAVGGLFPGRVGAEGEVGVGARAKYGVDVFTPSAPVIAALGSTTSGHDPRLGGVVGVAVSAFAGAKAGASLRAGIDNWLPAAEFEAEAFAGAKAALEGRVGAVIDDKEVGNVRAKGEVWSGAGAVFKGTAGFDKDRNLKVEGEAGAGYGYGAAVGVGVTVDVIGLAGVAAGLSADALDSKISTS